MANKFENQFYSRERVRFIQSLPCVVCGYRPCDNAHVKSRGSGGDYRFVVPLCRKHHSEQGRDGITTFQVRYELDLSSLAETTHSQWLEYQRSKNDYCART